MTLAATLGSKDDRVTDDGHGPISSFARRLALIALVGLGVRLAYVIGVRPHDLLSAPDSILYHDGANLLAKGHGFIDPYLFRSQGIARPAADHPPAYMLYLAVFSTLGFTSLLAHMIVSTFLGMATVVAVGLLGKEVGGPQVGLAAAAITAIYPPLVAIDGTVQSESMAVLVVTTFVYAVMKYRRRGTLRLATGLGALVGWAGTTRPEMLLLGVVVVVPVVVSVSVTTRDRVLHLGAATCLCFAIVMPWVVFNATRFEERVFLSTNLDFTIAATNCEETWHGTRIGYWSPTCALDALTTAGLGFEDGDQSQRGVEYRRAGFAYLEDHAERLPLVMSARVLRMVNVWDPPGQIRIDEAEGREYWIAAASVLGFYVLAAFALAGAGQLRREMRLRVELIGPLVVIVLTAALFMGNTRYRSPAEGVLCVLAAVGVQLLIRRRAGRTKPTAIRTAG